MVEARCCALTKAIDTRMAHAWSLGSDRKENSASDTNARTEFISVKRAIETREQKPLSKWTARCQDFHQVMSCLKLPGKLLRMSDLQDGGEGGIRTRQDHLDSVSYRFYNAGVAGNASDAVAPCTLLHANIFSGVSAGAPSDARTGGSTVQGRGRSVEPTSQNFPAARRQFCLRAQFDQTNPNPSMYEPGSS